MLQEDEGMHEALSAALYICIVALTVCARSFAHDLIVLAVILPKEVILWS